MRKLIMALVAAFVLATPLSSHAFDPKELLQGLTGGSKDNTENTDTESDNGGGLLGTIGDFLNNVTANKNFSIDDLVGTWSYTGPSVTFQSDNALKKIGGAGAATAVEKKLEPYYNKLGFNRTSLVVDKEHNFTLKMGALNLQGKIEKDDNNMLVFNFSAFGKVPLGKVAANATKSGNNLNLTFDATKMVHLLTKVSSVLNNKTLSTLSDLLNSYDGIYMGFKMKGSK